MWDVKEQEQMEGGRGPLAETVKMVVGVQI